MHVDHFIPWSFVKDDKIWNFVLSCPTCNVKKNNRVPNKDFLIDSVQERYISNHIDKIYGYDIKGYRTNYLIAYVRSGDFSGFVNRYTDFVVNYDYKFEKVGCLVNEEKQYPELRVIEIILARNGIQPKLIHILIHM